MALKTVIEKLDEVPEIVREHYVENKDAAGKVTYVLGLEGSMEVLQPVRDLRLEAGTFRTKLRDAEAKYGKLKAFDGMDPVEVLAKLDRIAELEAAAGGNLDDKKIEQIVEGRLKTKLSPIERQRDQLIAENNTLKAQVGEMTQKDKQRAITDQVRAAATALKMEPSAVDDAILLAERVMEVGEDGAVSVKDKSGYTPGLDVKSWLQDMQQKRPHWWGPSVGGGGRGFGGGAGGTGKNPFTNEHWNVTEQNNIYRADPTRAKQQAEAAGTKVGGGRPPAKK